LRRPLAQTVGSHATARALLASKTERAPTEADALG
jgi:hypothetical protein